MLHLHSFEFNRRILWAKPFMAQGGMQLPTITGKEKAGIPDARLLGLMDWKLYLNDLILQHFGKPRENLKFYREAIHGGVGSTLKATVWWKWINPFSYVKFLLGAAFQLIWLAWGLLFYPMVYWPKTADGTNPLNLIYNFTILLVLSLVHSLLYIAMSLVQFVLNTFLSPVDYLLKKGWTRMAHEHPTLFAIGILLSVVIGGLLITSIFAGLPHFISTASVFVHTFGALHTLMLQTIDLLAPLMGAIAAKVALVTATAMLTLSAVQAVLNFSWFQTLRTAFPIKLFTVDAITFDKESSETSALSSQKTFYEKMAVHGKETFEAEIDRKVDTRPAGRRRAHQPAEQGREYKPDYFAFEYYGDGFTPSC